MRGNLILWSIGSHDPRKLYLNTSTGAFEERLSRHIFSATMLLLFSVLFFGILHEVFGVVVLRSLEELSNVENDYDFIVVGGLTVFFS